MRLILRAPALVGSARRRQLLARHCRLPLPRPRRPTTAAAAADYHTPARRRRADAGGAPAKARGSGAGSRPRPYNRVVTPVAKTRDGLFKTHRIGSRLLFELPRGVMNKDILVVPRVAKAPPAGRMADSRLAASLVFVGSDATIACSSARFATTLLPTRRTRWRARSRRRRSHRSSRRSPSTRTGRTARLSWTSRGCSPRRRRSSVLARRSVDSGRDRSLSSGSPRTRRTSRSRRCSPRRRRRRLTRQCRARSSRRAVRRRRRTRS